MVHQNSSRKEIMTLKTRDRSLSYPIQIIGQNVAKNSKLDINAWKQQINEIMAEESVQSYDLKTSKEK